MKKEILLKLKMADFLFDKSWISYIINILNTHHIQMNHEKEEIWFDVDQFKSYEDLICELYLHLSVNLYKTSLSPFGRGLVIIHHNVAEIYSHFLYDSVAKKFICAIYCK